MKAIDIEKYGPQFHDVWNSFVDSSRQGTFMHRREYMEYHSDRFADHSLVALADGKVVALLPANIEGNTLVSHRGLTFAGWLTPAKGFDAAAMLGLWDAASAFLRAEGVSKLVYKSAAWIYGKCPADDDRYALFRNGASTTACLASNAIYLPDPQNFNENSRRNLKTAVRVGLKVMRARDYAPFWQVLCDLLGDRYGTTPVHTLSEITLLASLFPDNIELWTVTDAAGDVLAGTVMYITPTVAHTQYIAATPAGKEQGALALLFSELIEMARAGGCRYFDFGTSNEQGGLYLNEGLIRQKNGFGGRTVAYETFTVEI